MVTRSLLELDQYLIRRKVLTLFGASFHVYDPEDRLLGFSRQKAFKLREDIRVFADEEMQRPLLNVKAREIIDFSAAYDVVDPASGEKVGAARRKGFKSILRDSWEMLDAEDRPVGKVVEDSAGMAAVRRFVSNLVPQTFHVEDVSGTRLARFKQRFNPFVYKLEVNVDRGHDVDRRLIFGAALLIAAIEGRQG